MAADPASEPVGYSVSAVARRMGVAAATLRTWERRYGLSPSARTAGSHRRYTDADIAVLDRMRHHLNAGLNPAEAAAAAAAESTGNRHLASVPDSPVSQPPATPIEASAVSGKTRQRSLLRAAEMLDGPSIASVLHRCVNQRGVIWTWTEVVTPVLQRVGDRFGVTGEGIEIEHMLSNAIQAELLARTGLLTQPVNSRPVLLAAADEEQHTLPLFALAAALAERQIQSRMLGARVPPGALAKTVTRLGPGAVFIWSACAADPAQLASLPAQRPAPALLLGGPGWPAELAFEAQRPTDLTDAICRIVAAVT